LSLEGILPRTIDRVKMGAYCNSTNLPEDSFRILSLFWPRVGSPTFYLGLVVRDFLLWLLRIPHSWKGLWSFLFSGWEFGLCQFGGSPFLWGGKGFIKALFPLGSPRACPSSFGQNLAQVGPLGG